MLALCITGFHVHDILTDKTISVILTPVIKNKTGKLNCIDNYRPTALEYIL